MIALIFSSVVGAYLGSTEVRPIIALPLITAVSFGSFFLCKTLGIP